MLLARKSFFCVNKLYSLLYEIVSGPYSGPVSYISCNKIRKYRVFFYWKYKATLLKLTRGHKRKKTI